MKIKNINQKTKLGDSYFKSNRMKIIALTTSYIIVGVAGALLLLAGYTQAGLAKVVFPTLDSTAQSKNLLYLLSAETTGVIFGALLAMYAIRYLNVRWIFFSSFLIASIVLVLTAFINRITNVHPTFVRPLVFALLSFILGMCIGTGQPLATTLVGTVYTGDKRAKAMSYCNACYGIFAGIVPIILAPIIYQHKTIIFSEVKIFYLVATGIAFFTAILGLLVDFKHPQNKTSFKLSENDTNKFSLLIPIVIFSFLIVLYFIGTMVYNYMFVNIALGYNTSRHWVILATQSYGVYLVVKGLWRIFSARFLAHRMHPTNYLIMCALITIVAVGLILGNMMQYAWALFVIGVLAGIGMGNVWSTILAYAISVDHRRSSAIGGALNSFPQVIIPITQVISATLWTGYMYGTVSYFKFFSTIFLILAAMILMIICSIMTRVYFKKHPYLMNNKKL